MTAWEGQEKSNGEKGKLKVTTVENVKTGRFGLL